MKMYWPRAIALDKTGTPRQLFTYSAVMSINQCDAVFDYWQNFFKFRLLISWIDAEYEGGSKKIIHKKEYKENLSV